LQNRDAEIVPAHSSKPQGGTVGQLNVIADASAPGSRCRHHSMTWQRR